MVRILVAGLVAAGVLALPALAAAPTGLIVFSRADGDDDRELFSIRPDGSGLTRLTDDDEFEAQPVLSPDRRLIASAGDAVLVVRTASGQLQRRIAVPADGKISEPRWSARGAWIAFLVERCGNDEDEPVSPPSCADLWVVRPDGTGLRRLVAANVSTLDRVAAYDWSPEGRSLVFERLREPALVVVDVAGRRMRRLGATARLGSTDPSWSRRGSIAFARRRAAFAGYDLYTVRADGRRLRRIARARSATRPTWSPDGRRVAFLDFAPASGLNRWRVTVVRADGRGRRQVGLATSDAALEWAPDGTRLLWQNAPNRIVVGRADGRGNPKLLTLGSVPDWR
jgi:Tol biopolymer transport system component